MISNYFFSKIFNLFENSTTHQRQKGRCNRFHTRSFMIATDKLNSLPASQLCTIGQPNFQLDLMYVGVELVFIFHTYFIVMLPLFYLIIILSMNRQTIIYIATRDKLVPEATAERILVDAINIIKLSSKPLTTDEMNIGYFFCTN